LDAPSFGTPVNSPFQHDQALRPPAGETLRSNRSRELIESERYRYAWDSFPLFVAALCCGFALEIVASWKTNDPAALLAWGGFITGWVLWSLWVLALGRKPDFAALGREGRDTRMQTLLIAVGTLVGTGWLALFPDNEINSVSFVFFHTGYMVISLLCFGGARRLFLLAVIPTLVPIPIALFLTLDTLRFPLQMAVLLIPGIILAFQLRFRAMHSELLELRFKNIDLFEDLQRQRDAAEAANLAKSTFLATASHDLRQPMHSLNLYLASAAAYPLSEDLREMVQRMQQCARYMNEMFDSLLDIARLDAQVIAPRLEPLSLQPILLRLQSDFTPLASAKALSLEFVSEPHLYVMSDAGMVERILRNLLANALSYTRLGRVQLVAKRRGNRVRVAVIDSGPGVPRALRGLIFEEFVRAPGPSQSGSRGFGLGLAIARRLALILSIRLRLRSSAFRGSSFSINIPAAPFAQFRLEDRAERNAALLSGLLVLVVDDDLEVLTAMTLLLTLQGCRVLAAGNSQEALQQVERMQEPPSLLLCDFALGPAENGLELIERIRDEFNEDLPALLITGETSPTQVQRFARSRVEVLHKPVDGDALVQAMQRAIHRQGQHAELAG
jgi:signal transduction histidine kinase/ActR/RegA family two-component response regulator